jgi:HEAT repeat protein
VVDTLATVGSKDAGLTALFGNWMRNYPNPAVRLAALKNLPKMKDANLQVANLIAALGAEKDPAFRKEVIATIGQVGKGNEAAWKALSALLSDPSKEIQDAAKASLKKLEIK